MTFAVHVEGGTGAGSKRPLKEKPRDWVCRCVLKAEYVTIGGYVQPEQLKTGSGLALTYAERPGHLARCPDCGTRRPG